MVKKLLPIFTNSHNFPIQKVTISSKKHKLCGKVERKKHIINIQSNNASIEGLAYLQNEHWFPSIKIPSDLSYSKDETTVTKSCQSMNYLRNEIVFYSNQKLN